MTGIIYEWYENGSNYLQAEGHPRISYNNLVERTIALAFARSDLGPDCDNFSIFWIRDI